MDIKINDIANIFPFLEQKCKEKGLSLTEVCRDANVERSGLERWKKENPKTLNSVADILTSIDRLSKKS